MRKTYVAFVAAIALIPLALWAQGQRTDEMPGMSSDVSAHAMHSMEERHMDMGPHMKMTNLRELKPGDQEKADQIVQAARKTADKYENYKTAVADGKRRDGPRGGIALVEQSVHASRVEARAVGRGGEAQNAGRER